MPSEIMDRGSSPPHTWLSEAPWCGQPWCCHAGRDWYRQGARHAAQAALPRFVLLVSGLGLGSGSGESLLSTQLLVDVVTGQLGAEGEQSCAAQISRVILAGNLLSQNTQSRDTINKVQWGRGLQH